jgi:hypothetical protein
MPFYTNCDRLYACLGDVLTRIQREAPQAAENVSESRLLIRLKCTAPASEILINGRRRPFQTSFGPSPMRPDLEMELAADTLHQLLLHELSTKKAVASGLIKVRGPAWKLSPLIGIIQAGRSVYAEVLRKQMLV